MARKIQHATICFLVKGDLVLLGMKKRGMGVDLWNGVGGKVEEGETIREAATRESNEEIGVRIVSLEKVADLYFYFIDDPNEKDWNGHAFLVTEWKGEPEETEEMKPKWFKKEDVPYKQMWDADHLWIPKILNGEKVKARIGFDKNNKLIKHSLKIVKGF